VDVDTIIDCCVSGAFAFLGQVCISLQRAYVHEELMAEFAEKLVAATKKLKSGDPSQADTDYAALISTNEAQWVMDWIEEAKAGGAKVLMGGERMGDVISPVIVTNASSGLRVSYQEVFGPVVVLYSFSDLDEAIHQVNDSVYGLQAGICTPSLNHALLAAKKSESWWCYD
jgi:acyl-CoA reductase-like NAD-dependent aldehyde dehydrogenase